MAFVEVSRHVRNRSQADLVARLSDNKVEGFVFPRTASGWVTVVTDKDHPLKPNSTVPGLEQETLIYYWYSRERCWGFGLAYSGKLLMSHSCDWSHPPKVVLSTSVEAKVLSKVCRAHLSERQMGEVNRLLALDTIDALMEYEPYVKVPRMLGLDHFENLSFQLLDRDPERSISQHPGLRWVAVQDM